MMNYLKLYKYATWGLLLLNVVVLAFFLQKKPKLPHPPPPHNFQSQAVKILDLDAEQETHFRALADSHYQKMKSIKQQQQKLLLPYFETITKSSDKRIIENTLNQFQLQEREKIEVTYQHFEEIKALLNQEQLPNFELFMEKIIDRVLLDKEKKPRPPKRLN